MIVPGFVARITVGESSYYLGTGLLLKMVLLDLGFHHLLPRFYNFHKGTFVCGWLPNYHCWLQMRQGTPIFGQVTDVIPPHTSL